MIDRLKKKDENTQIVLINSMISFGIKGLSMLVAFLTTPVYIQYFHNNQVLGVWFTILSVLSWILNCDLGIGNGLRNQLVYAISEKNKDKVKKYISSSYFFLFAIGMILLIIFAIINHFANWNVIFNISTNDLSHKKMNQSMLILIASVLLQLILRLVISIYYALQKAFIPGLLNLITNFSMLCVAKSCNIIGINGSFIILSWAYLIAVNLPLVIATLIIFNTKLKFAKPSFQNFRMDYAKSILKVGGIFLWLQLMSLILDNTNSYLITIFVNNAAVVEYQFYYKVFNLIPTVFLILSSVVWSTITKAKSEGNWYWLKFSFNRLMIIGILASVIEFLQIIPLQWFFNVWLKAASISVDYGTAIIFVLSGICVLWRIIVTTYANGLCELKLQEILLTFGALINIPLAYWFSQYSRSYTAIVIANIISMLPYCFAQTKWFIKYLNRNYSTWRHRNPQSGRKK